MWMEGLLKLNYHIDTVYEIVEETTWCFLSIVNVLPMTTPSSSSENALQTPSENIQPPSTRFHASGAVRQGFGKNIALAGTMSSGGLEVGVRI